MSPRRARYRHDQPHRNRPKTPAHPNAALDLDVRYQDLARGHEPSPVKIFKALIIAVPILLLIVIFIRPPPPPPSRTYTEIGGSVPPLIDKHRPKPAHIPARFLRSIPNETQDSSPCASTKFAEWVEWPGTGHADRDQRCQSESECQFPGIDGDDCGTSVCLLESVAAIPALLLFFQSIDGEGDERQDLLCIKGPEMERLARRFLKSIHIEIQRPFASGFSIQPPAKDVDTGIYNPRALKSHALDAAPDIVPARLHHPHRGRSGGSYAGDTEPLQDGNANSSPVSAIADKAMRLRSGEEAYGEEDRGDLRIEEE